MREYKDHSQKGEVEHLTVQIQFYPENATAILNIDKNEVGLDAKRIDAERRGLSPKEEFHLTIIGNDTGEEILRSVDLLGEGDKNRVLTQVQELCDSFEWKANLEQEYYYLEKDYDIPADLVEQGETTPEKRRSIIQSATIENLDAFYQKLNLLLGKQFKTPFPHVTLYTTSTIEGKKLRGIGIYSKDQFEALNPEKI